MLSFASFTARMKQANADKPPLTVWFIDFKGFDGPRAIDFIRTALARRFSISLDPGSPDVLFYSYSPGLDFRKYRCRRVFFSGENRGPDFAECDFALTFDFDSERNLRLPYYVVMAGDDLLKLCAARDGARLAADKTKFCNFIYSHFRSSTRNLFFRALHARKPVDAAGKLYNNAPAPSPRYSANWREAKIEFMRDYKFSIAFENESWPGYTTEKIADAFLAGSVPIYYGDPKIVADFNPEAFVNCHDYRRWDDVVARVLQIDADDSLLARYLSASPFVDGRLPACADPDRIADRLADFLSASPPRLAADNAYAKWQRLAPCARVVKARTFRMGGKKRSLPCTLAAPAESESPPPPLLPGIENKSAREMRRLLRSLLRQKEYSALRECWSRWRAQKPRGRFSIFLWLVWWSLVKNRIGFWRRFLD